MNYELYYVGYKLKRNFYIINIIFHEYAFIYVFNSS